MHHIMPEGFDAVLETSTYSLTDMGNAELFLKISGHSIYYDAPKKTGYIYGLDPRNNCVCWVPDPTGIQLLRKLDKFAHRLNEMAKQLNLRRATADTTNKVKELRKILQARLTSFAGPQAKRIAERIYTKSANPKIIMDDPIKTGHLVNFPNGTLNLRTGQLRAPRKDDYISQGCPTEYHAGAMTPEVDAWLNSICITPEIRRQFLQVLGVAMDASNFSKTIPMMFGSSTNNGKTTAINAIMATIGRTENGGYGQTISAGAFDKGTRTGGKCTPELATVVGARLVSMSEPAENQPTDWAYMKAVAGGGDLQVNPKNKPAYTIKAVFTLIIDTNYLLRVDDPTMFKRGSMQIIPFLRSFSPTEIDRSLEDRLAKEKNREAILAAIVGGYQDYIASGGKFIVPQEAADILKMYENTSDRLGEFLAQTYVKVEGREAVRARIPLTDVYADYR